MSEPVIFHDFIIGLDPWWRAMIEGVEAGRVSYLEMERGFFIPGVGFNRSAFLASATLLSYRACGQQAFVIGPKLQEMFDHTSLEDVEIDEIRLPYDAFYVATPDCPWQVWGGSSGWHDLTGVLVRSIADDPSKPGHAGIFLYIWGTANENSTNPGDDASYWLTIDLEEAKTYPNLEDYLVAMLMDNACDTSANDYAKWFRDTDHVINLPAAGTERREQFVNTAVRVARLVVNMCMYINSQGPEITPDERRAANVKRRKQIEAQLGAIKNLKKRKGKVRQLQDELNSLSTTNIVWLGKTIETSSIALPRGPLKGPRKHTWVRGHWWPRLSTLRAQQTRQQFELDAASAEIVEAKKVIAATNDPAELAAAALRLGEASKVAQEASTRLVQVVQTGEKKRRWVQPYERNKDSSQKVKGHVYLVDGPSPNHVDRA